MGQGEFKLDNLLIYKVGLLTGGPLFTFSVWLLLFLGQGLDVIWPYLEIGYAFISRPCSQVRAQFVVKCLIWLQPYFLLLAEQSIKLGQVMWIKFLGQDSWNIFMEVIVFVALFSKL